LTSKHVLNDRARSGWAAITENWYTIVIVNAHKIYLPLVLRNN
jgi:hypothetical protein